jgi:hypothetical protein
VRATNSLDQKATAAALTWKQGLASRLRVAEWRDSPHLPGLLVVSILTTLLIAVFYINEPYPPSSADTASYLTVAERIKNHFTFTDVYRTPGYPLFIAIVFLIFGDGDVRFVSVAQAALYLLAAIELYVIAYMIFRRVWIATVVALAAGVNVLQFSYAKGVIAEGFAMWTVVTFGLAVVLFFQKPGARRLWLIAAALMLTLMTRTEWMYIAVPLFAFLVMSTRGLGLARRLALHALGAVVLLYGALGAYTYANGPQNGYGPFVVIPRINGLGKVFQYRMQDDAPPKYASWTRRIDVYLGDGHVSPQGLADGGPYVFGELYPQFSANNFQLAGEYSRATILNAPGEYLWKTVKFADSANKYRWGFGVIHQHRPFAGLLNYLQTMATQTYATYRYFPLFAVGCLALWLVAMIKWIGYYPRIHMIAALAFMGLYQLFVVTAGGYADWPRLYMTLNPTRILVVFGPALLGLGFLAGRAERRILPLFSRRAELVWWAWLAMLSLVVLPFIVFALTEHIGVIAWDSKEWLKVYPAPTVLLTALCAWVTLLAHRVRRVGHNGSKLTEATANP